MSSTVAQTSLKRTLNGDREAMDGATRRGLFDVAASTDELRDHTDAAIGALTTGFDRLRKAAYGVIGSTLASAVVIIITAAGG